MIINQGNLRTLYIGFKTLFNNALGQAANQYSMVATTVPSTTKEEEYGWLGKVPGVRKWVGDRVIQNLMAHRYSIENEPYELTISVIRDHIEDDSYGVYNPLFTEMGMSVGAHPDELVWPLLQNGFDGICYDGQAFFDTDHPVLDASGREISVANTDGGGTGPGWYLLSLNRAIRPIIYQTRRAFDMVALDRPDDPNVFHKREYVYGVDGRFGAGYGLWQTAWGSRQPLTKETYAHARQSLMSMTGDYGRPLGIVGTHLVYPPALEGAALEILNAERDAAGATNVYRGTAEGVNVPWLR